jgi:pyrimidine-nucleoside phosphorylase
MSKYEDARLLAGLMVETGELAGTRTVALMTAMDEPLGRFAGNWVEVMECLELMQHFSPAHEFRLGAEQLRLSADLLDLTHALTGHMLHIGGKAATPEDGAKLSAKLMSDGSAYLHFMEMVQLQSDTWEAARAALDHPSAFHKPSGKRVLKSETAGYLAGMDCRQVGWAVQRLGAGRAKPGDPVGAHTGIEMHVKVGDRVELGQPLVTLFSENPALLAEPEEMLRETLCMGAEKPVKGALVREVVGK